MDKAWAWAQARGKVRTNEIHGEEEIQIVLSETFEVNNADIEEVDQTGNITVQDTCGFRDRAHLISWAKRGPE